MTKIMEFAIVDIETTGGYASGSGITEIAIIISDGVTVIDRFETLINPLQAIPFYIQGLTGITNEMVAESPLFSEVAEKIYTMLTGRVFVAHNVNFDYSFIKHQLSQVGYQFSADRLCTVRLSRKIKPGLKSYSLGKLCCTLNIPIEGRHRAGGDAMATYILLSKLLEWDEEGYIQGIAGKRSKEQQLPPNLNREDYEKLPQSPGVYYFSDRKGKVIYVGKAKNIQKRVSSHFTGHNPRSQRQNFLREIHSIRYESCSTELMALLLEAVEIKRLWPSFNRAMKRKEPKFALYSYEDQTGYTRLAVGAYKKGLPHLQLFNSAEEAYSFLRRLIHKFKLVPALCGLKLPTDGDIPTPEHYNPQVIEAIKSLKSDLPSFAIFDKGRKEEESSCVWIENGSLYGFGYIDRTVSSSQPDMLKSMVPKCEGNHYMMQLVRSYAAKFPEKVIHLQNELVG